MRRSDPVFTLTAAFIEKELDKIASLDNITVEGIVEKARWRDRLKKIAQQSIHPTDSWLCLLQRRETKQ